MSETVKLTCILTGALVFPIGYFASEILASACFMTQTTAHCNDKEIIFCSKLSMSTVPVQA